MSKKTVRKSKKQSVKKPELVKIYTTPTCPWCKKTKEFFKANKVKYREIDVASDSKARAESFEKSGQMGVPVIDINGEIIVGYDVGAFKKALGL